MNNQILDDFQENSRVVEYPLGRYRTIGVLRLLIVLIFIFVIMSNYQYVTVDFQNENFKWSAFLVYAFFSLFFILPVIYHIKQSWAELRLKTGFAKKKIFRGVAIVSSILFIFMIICALIYQVITNLSEPSEERIFKIIGNLIGAAIFLGVFIPVLRMDRKYRLQMKRQDTL